MATNASQRHAPSGSLTYVDGPTTEQRIVAAMALAGIDFDQLALRIGTPNYGARTLRKIADANDDTRPARRPDLRLIGEACGVAEAFWTIDFSALQDPDALVALQTDVTKLREALAGLATDSLRHTRELQELRDRDRQTALPGDGPE